MPSGNGLGRDGVSPEPLEAVLAALRSELAGLRAENTRLLRLLELSPAQARLPGPVQTGLFDAPPGLVNAGSPAAAKVAFFGALFGARTDVYAVRWQNTRSRRSGWMPAVYGGWRRGLSATEREYLPLTTQVLTGHLSGELEVGLYPMLDGDQCWWLAADFDGPAAILDALAYLKAARTVGAPAALEVSRSGVGAHAWLFFTEPVSATLARLVGTGLLREAIALRGRIAWPAMTGCSRPRTPFRPAVWATSSPPPCRDDAAAAAPASSWTWPPWNHTTTSGPSCPRSGG